MYGEDTPALQEGEDSEPQADDSAQLFNGPYAYDIPGSYEQLFGDDEDDGALVTMAESGPGVAGLGKKGGIKLTSDVAFLTNVFGNPRVEMVEIQGTVYALRIASVMVANQPRTRLVATVLGGNRPAGTKQVLDFKLNPAIEGMSREELCNYEFAPQVNRYDDGNGMVTITAYRLEVAFVSGRRNTQSLASAATDLVLSYVQFYHDGEMGFTRVLTSTSWPGSKVFDSAGNLPYHCISNLDLTLDESAWNQHISLITYLVRESAWNPKDANGSLQHVEDDGALGPGKTSVYLIEITIPAGWSGRKDITLVTRNCEVATGMTGQAEDEDGGNDAEVIEYSVDPESGVLDLVLADECYWEAAAYDDAPVSVYAPGETPGKGTNPVTPSGSPSTPSGGPGSSGSKTGGNRTATSNKLPQMGDTSQAAVMAGVAAAGAALAALGFHTQQEGDD